MSASAGIYAAIEAAGKISELASQLLAQNEVLKNALAAHAATLKPAPEPGPPPPAAEKEK
jgi:hypothetical protein